MKIFDEAAVREWVDLDLDGGLDPGAGEKSALEDSLAEHPELRAERRQLEVLHEMLAESRIAVRPDFAAAVVSDLPVASWERSLQSNRAPAWLLPLAMLVTLAVGAAAMLAFGGAGASHPALGTLGVVWDFVATTTLAGAGLLFATWRGVGLGVEQWVAESGLNMMALAAAVFFLDLLFLSLMRRRRTAVCEVDESRRDAGRG